MKTQENCIFCKINKGEIPSYTLYEDELVRVFLDVFPKAKGHLLIISKDHDENIFDASDEVLARINVVAKKMALILQAKLGATGVNIVNNSGIDAGQEVLHLHYHVIPRYKNDNFKVFALAQENKGLDFKDILARLKS